PGPVVTDDAALGLTLNLDAKGVDQPLSKYLPATLQPNTWYTVTVPLLDLMTAPTKLYRVFFWSMSSTHHAHYFVDDLALVLGGAPPTQTPPVFTSVAVTGAGPDSVRVAWATDRPSRFTLRYTKNGSVVTKAFSGY